MLVRFTIICISGYVCTLYFSSISAYLFSFFLPHAQAIFLGMFIALFFFLLFFLYAFTVSSLKRLAWWSLSLCLTVYILSLVIG